MAMVTKELRLTELQGRGRSLAAAQPLKAGQIILRDSPILLYSSLPSSSSPSPYCSHCFKTLSTQNAAIWICQSCSRHAFCGPTCLSAAQSSSHTPWVCAALGNLHNCHSNKLSDDRRVQARFLIAAYNLAATSPESFQTLLSLQGRDSSDAQLLHSLLSSICPPPPNPELFTVELTAALLAKDKLNAFGLMEPPSETGVRSSRAYGFYPKASFFNHDCLPNACRFDYVDQGSADIVIRMIHDVPEGREVCLSYFPVNQGYSSRQRTLSEEYGFVCQCDRCNVEANWSDNEVDAVADEEGGGPGSMEEDRDEEMEEGSESEHGSDIGEDQGGDEFPHAYFFVRFMCSKPNCWGTLAPLPPKDDGTASDVMECNVCGSLKKDEEIGGGHGPNGVSLDG